MNDNVRTNKFENGGILFITSLNIVVSQTLDTQYPTTRKSYETRQFLLLYAGES